ncbi:MAG: glycosyltransferase family 4 protein [Terracidiphilus sp.]
MVAYTNYLSDARPRREAETLVRRGDRVDFITLGEKDRPSTETVAGVRLLRVRQRKYQGGSGARYILSYVRFLCGVTLKLARLHLKERYDVVYVHTMPDLLVLVGLIPKLFGARIVLNVHDMMPELYMSKFGIAENHALIRLLAFQEQLSIRLADRVICVHDPHRDALCRRGAPRAKITVLPNVPDPLVFRGDRSGTGAGGAFRIVYHGTITRRLGLDLAVRAFAKAADSCPGARLEIFGDGDASDELEAQIEASGAADRISFSRKMFRVEAITEMIQGASAGIVANRRDAATEYMLPVKLLEFVHLGIPAIAPRLMTIQYYFGEDQVEYYEPGNVDELSEAMRRLYADAGRRAQLATKGAEFAKRFNWDVFKLELYKVVDGGTDAAPAAVAQDTEKNTTASTK